MKESNDSFLLKSSLSEQSSDSQEFLFAKKSANKKVPKSKDFYPLVESDLNDNNFKKNKDPESKEKKKLSFLNYFLVALFIVFVISIIILVLLDQLIEKVKSLYKDEEFTKPLTDNRTYEIIRLQNGVEVIAIHDVSATRCSAAAVVGSGAMTAEETQGIPHLTEHSLFLGAGQFDKEDILDTFANNSGYINGETEKFKTSFYFEIGKNHFQKALKVLSEMLISPKLTETLIKDEITNINEDYVKTLNRIENKEDHIINNFVFNSRYQELLPMGNSETLSKVKDLQAEIKKYLKENFVADNIKVALLCSDSLYNVKGLAIRYFKGIPQRESKAEVKESFAKEQKFGKVIRYDHNDIFSYVSVLYYLPNNFDASYLNYFKYLLDHNSDGSLFEALNILEKGVANLTTTIQSKKNYIEFRIKVTLIKTMVPTISEVIDKIYNYIHLIKNSDNSRKKYDEIKKILEKNFNFAEEKESLYDFLIFSAKNLFLEKNENFTKLYKYEDYIPEYNESIINEIKSAMTPENSVILIGLSDNADRSDIKNFYFVNEKDFLNTTRTAKTKYYKISYKEASLTKKAITKLSNITEYDKYMSIPKEDNPFITNETNIVYPKNDAEYEIQSNSSILAEYIPYITPSEQDNFTCSIYKKDLTLNLPKVQIIYHLIHLYSRNATRDEYLKYLFYYNSLTRYLWKDLKQAIIAGTSIKTEENEYGIFIYITTFSDIVEKIVSKVVPIIFDKEVDKEIEEEGDLIEEMVEKNIRSYEEMSPIESASYYFKIITKKKIFNHFSISKENVTHMKRDIKKFQDEMITRQFFYGNIEKEQVSNLTQNYLREHIASPSEMINSFGYPISSIFSYFAEIKDIPPFSIVYIPAKQRAAISYFWFDDYKTESFIYSSLIRQIFGDLFFNKLRTEKKIGTDVLSKKLYYSGKVFYVFGTQSGENNSNRSEIQIDKDIDGIIGDFYDKIAIKLTSKELNENKRTLQKDSCNVMRTLESRAKKMLSDVFYTASGRNTTVQESNLKIEDLIDTKKDSKYGAKEIKEKIRETFFTKVHKLSIQFYVPEEGKTYNRTEEETYFLNSSLSTVPTSNLLFLQEDPELQ